MADCESIISPPDSRHVLTLRTKITYSVGHVFNDLCASMWFTYLLVYQHFVLEFRNSIAGDLLLIGQIADGLATPFVGIESDKPDQFVCKYGRRKTWHLLGTICVLLSFPFLFLKCVGCSHSHQSAQFVYYSAFIIIFQFGWAAVQVSHLSLIPDLTPISSERVALNAYRYACTVSSNILIYLITWLMLGLNSEGKNSLISPKDSPEFWHIALIVVSVGTLFSIIFHLGVREPPHVTASIQNGSINSEIFLEPHLTWRDWLKEIQFYKIGLLYMSTRLYNNLSQAYIPLYLQDSLQLPRESIAIIPLVVYVSGFVSSFFMKYLSSKIGKKTTYFVGCILALIACVWLYFGEGDDFRYREIFGVSSLIGIAGCTMLILSLSITSDMIGVNTSSGAFVFGAMSFLDKLANGIAVVTIQNLQPCMTCCSSCKWYYKYILIYVCGGSVISALIALASLLSSKIGETKSRGLIRNNRAEICDRESSKENATDDQISDNAPLILDTSGVCKASQTNGAVIT
ncbi:major facilitator superfamily domain-containing protein 12-like [Centruroides vittatus]|uniref:major facilitator superfamily domain-containing protein 12-like n=1 Tax=Centruroides vittatus TaxID=120091 RepID=UPI003510C9D2